MAARQQVQNAIFSKHAIRFQYDPITRGVAGERTVLPHALGKTTRRNKLVLRAWVLDGNSNTGLTRSDRWRMFRVDRMRDVDILPQRFAKTRRGFRPNDKHMKPGRLVVQF